MITILSILLSYLLFISRYSSSAFVFSNGNINVASCIANRHYSNSVLHLSDYNKWDNLVDDDEDDEIKDMKPTNIPNDMRYIERNIKRQHENFLSIREAGGSELTYDLYARESSSSSTFWFVGKIAKISDVSVEDAIERQWPLIESHCVRLRPVELYPYRGSTLEIWYAPGDSELDVAYNRPDLQFIKVDRPESCSTTIKNRFVGFQGEIYENNEQGFRTLRKNNGFAMNPEIQTPTGGNDHPRPANEVSQEDLQTNSNQVFSEEEFQKIQEQLKGHDIEELYEKQQIWEKEQEDKKKSS